jgi:hypothetical protein
MGYVTLLIFLLLLSVQTWAQVEVFDNYDTTIILKGDSIQVRKTISIKNTATTAIIPGEIFFTIEDKPKIFNVKARDKNGELPFDIFQGSDNLRIVITIFEPLLPGASHSFSLDYEIAVRQSGILFHEIAYKPEQTNLPIVSGEYIFQIPKGNYITYAPNAKIQHKDGYTQAVWRISPELKEMRLEYSVLPIPRLPIQAVYPFWAVVILISAMILILSIRRYNLRRIYVT